jgi:hypothetical protein
VKGANILYMPPDTGERYPGTAVFSTDTTEKELAISRPTPARTQPSDGIGPDDAGIIAYQIRRRRLFDG